MGCDIHLFIEYKMPESEYWRNLGSEFRLGRHYGVFASLADVRNYGDEIEPIASPRGVPEVLGFRTRDEYLYFICGNPSEDQKEVTQERADDWLKRGISRSFGDSHVSDPDAHSESWLTPDEFDKAIHFALEGKVVHDIADYEAVLAAMRSMEKSGFEVRTVFWFDN